MTTLSNTFNYFATNNPTIDQFQYLNEYDTGLIKVGDGINPYKTLPYLRLSYTRTSKTGVSAFAGGGQSNATQLFYEYNAIDIVVTNLDSVKCTIAIKGNRQIIRNFDTNTANLYPFIGDKFIGMAINTPIPIDAGNGIELVCYENGTWRF